MAHLINVESVVVLNSKKEKIGHASGRSAIRLVLKDFAEQGKGKVLVFLSSADDKVCLAMSHGGDLQIGCP